METQLCRNCGQPIRPVNARGGTVWRHDEQGFALTYCDEDKLKPESKGLCAQPDDAMKQGELSADYYAEATPRR